MKKVYIIGLVVSCMITGCAGNSAHDTEKQVESVGQNIVDQVNNVVQSQDEHVLAVKNGYPQSYPKCTYGNVFDEFFGSPTWSYFKADSGEEVVEFTGYCMYRDAEVKARLQFILDADGNTFSTGALSFNDIPQENIVIMSLIDTAFEKYMEAHNIEKENAQLEEEITDTFTPQMEPATLDTAVDYGKWSYYGDTWLYSETTDCYMITFIENGEAEILFSADSSASSASALYYVDNINFEIDGDELISTGEIYPASRTERDVLGTITINWGRWGESSSPIMYVENNNVFEEKIISNDYVYLEADEY